MSCFSLFLRLVAVPSTSSACSDSSLPNLLTIRSPTISFSRRRARRLCRTSLLSEARRFLSLSWRRARRLCRTSSLSEAISLSRRLCRRCSRTLSSPKDGSHKWHFSGIWGEPERAPSRAVNRLRCLYVCGYVCKYGTSYVLRNAHACGNPRA